MSGALPLIKAKSLRETGRDEYWLQDFIYNDPSCLGLGELERVSREKQTASGGKLDLLLKDIREDHMFEVEVMLGSADESHIIRTIEYWELEKRRYPRRQHTAVLVAERINSRFYNVVHLLAQSIPIIGIQVNALESKGELVGIHFLKVVDSYQEPEIETPSESAQFDENYWQRTYPVQTQLALKLKEMASELVEDVALRYLEQYLVFTIGRWDRVKLRPRKNGLSQVEYRIAEDKLEEAAAACAKAGISARLTGDRLAFEMDDAGFEQHRNLHALLLRALYERDLRLKGAGVEA